MTPNIQEKLEQLNQFTRRTFTEEEVFLFDVKLCDNEIDRDGERFSLEALAQLKTLFVGKTGIFDHIPSGENQTARIYATQLVEEPERQTTSGEPYTYLKGQAYMIRTEKNGALIQEIDGGIKKEVSVSCAVSSRTCSICGCEQRSGCVHQNGMLYGEKLCHTVLSDITDAYEWSFVAIPAQREAGVTKRFRNEKDTIEKQRDALQKQLAEQTETLLQVEDHVRQDIIRLQFLTEGVIEADAISEITKHMDLKGLLHFQKTLRKKQLAQCQPQLTPVDTETTNSAFQM
ncbi:MAG: hypothetical protein LUF89_04600 [Ruminococcus sp.]|nr:hypothetical protein [Ruminococcus sp.]